MAPVSTGLVSDLQSVSVGGATTNQTIKFTNATEGANITSNLYVGSNLHLDDVTLAAASVTLQGVTTNGATTTDAITITDTTEATTTSTGALKVSRGIAAAKDIRAANVVVNRVGVGLTAGANPSGRASRSKSTGTSRRPTSSANSLTLDSVALHDSVFSRSGRQREQHDVEHRRHPKHHAEHDSRAPVPPTIGWARRQRQRLRTGVRQHERGWVATHAHALHATDGERRDRRWGTHGRER